jgi:hypothetical protein
MITKYNAEQMAKKSQWVDLRHRVLPHVIQFIAAEKDLERKWIEQNILFTPGSSLPMTINMNSFAKGFWKKPYLELGCGTSIYLDEEILHIIVRNAVTRNRSKSLARNRQEKAGALSREHRIKLLDPSKGYLFKAKYLGIMLLDDTNHPRKISSVKFDENVLTRAGGWYVMASLAQKKPSDYRVYTVDVATGDALRFNCSKLSKYVKKFNKI